jgi:hypothetical protein
LYIGENIGLYKEIEMGFIEGLKIVCFKGIGAGIHHGGAHGEENEVVNWELGGEIYGVKRRTFLRPMASF